MNAASRRSAGAVSLLILTGVLAVACLPASAQTFDLSRDYSRLSNPAGVWTYGFETTVGGGFTPYTDSWQATDNGGALIDIWSKSDHDNSAVYHNGSTVTGSCCNGAGTFPPGTIWFTPGVDGHPDNFGAIRFTVPAGGAGTYRLESAARHYLDGPPAGDTDLHVVQDGVELFGQNLPGGGSATGYTNTLALSDGDTIDFLVGRGIDNHLYGSGLKIQATVDLIDTNPAAPTILTQPQSQTVLVGANVSFNVVANGTAPLSYQWLQGGAILAGATD